MKRAALGLIVLFLLMLHSSLAENPAMCLQEKLERGQDISLKECIISDGLSLRNLNLTRDSDNRFIVNSSIEFTNCEVKGRLGFGLASFKKPVRFIGTKFSESVTFTGSKFYGDCSFHNAEFKNTANFDGANFTRGTDFINARFENVASFKNAAFFRPAFFRKAKFFDDFNFRGTTSSGAIDFQETEFYKSAVFSQAKFNGSSTFQAAKFLDISWFDDAVLNGEAGFEKSLFASDANFNNASFASRAKFLSSRFQDIARFSRSNFKRDANFRRSKFEGPADFSSANFSGTSNFDEMEFFKIAKFNNANFSGNTSFFGSYFEKDAKFEGAVFRSMLNLSGATYSQLALSWDSIRGHLIKDKKANQSLINNYKNMVWIKDRNQCYYDYRNEKRISSDWGFSRIMDSASWIYWGYGVRPYNAIISILALIFLFSLIYRWLASRSKSSISFRDALTLSARTLLLKSPGDVKIEGKHAHYAIWIQKVIFGFFVALFIVFLNQEIQSYFKPPT